MPRRSRLGAVSAAPRRRRATTTITCPVVAPDQRIRVCVTRPAEPGEAVHDHHDVCRILRGAETADRESFYALHLDSQNRLIGVEEVAKGGTAFVEVEPATIFRSAVASGASALIVAHNHPSGNAKHSDADNVLSERIRAAATLLGFRVLDHVIVAAEGCGSAQAQGRGGFSGYADGPSSAPTKSRKRRT